MCTTYLHLNSLNVVTYCAGCLSTASTFGDNIDTGEHAKSNKTEKNNYSKKKKKIVIKIIFKTRINRVGEARAFHATDNALTSKNGRRKEP